MQRSSYRARVLAALAITLVVAACGGAPTTQGPPTPTSAPTVAPSSASTAASTSAPTAIPAATQGSTGAANLDAVQEIEAGKVFQVNWTGPNGPGDFVTIVLGTATQWTNEDFFYTTIGTPGELTAPSTDGAYALWYVSGADRTILARRALRVTLFQGDLLAPASVPANTRFEVAWNGPNGPGDYVTIVKADATAWTNESFFYTTLGSPGPLVAPLEAGDYEIWYVIGSDTSIQARRPITVTAAVVTLEAPVSVAQGASFEVTWTGPNGPGDYVTIVPVGSPNTAYLSFFYTTLGSPGPLKAPDDAGDYEIWYVAGSGTTVLETRPIRVT